MMPELTPDIPLQKKKKKKKPPPPESLRAIFTSWQEQKKSQDIYPPWRITSKGKDTMSLASLSLSLITDLVLYALIDYFGAD